MTSATDVPVADAPASAPARPRARRGFRAVLVLIEVIGLLVLAEFGFRMVVPWQNYFGTIGRAIRLSEHPPFEDRMLTPRQGDGQPVRVRADANGFLLPDGAEPGRPVHLTIAFLGGSATESLWVAEDHRWPLVAGRTVGRLLGKNVRVINAGIAGSNLQLTTNIFFNKVLRLKPDVVVIDHAWNDCGLLVMRGNYEDWTLTAPTDQRGPLRAMYESLTAHVNTLGYLRHLWAMRQINANLRGRMGGGTDGGRVTTAAALDESVAQQYDTRLAILIGAIRTAGAQPVVLTGATAGGGVDAGATDPNWVPGCHIFNDRARTVAARTGAPVIDLARRISDPALFFDLAHYNDRGSRTAGEIIGRELQDIAARALSR